MAISRDEHSGRLLYATTYSATPVEEQWCFHNPYCIPVVITTQRSSLLRHKTFSLGSLDHPEFPMFFTQMFMPFVHILTESTHSGPSTYHKELVSYLIVIE